MQKIQIIFYNLIPYTELLCMLFGFFHFKKLKNTYWKWFVYYMVFITIVEFFSLYYLKYFPYLRKYYFDFFVIPIEFLFLYWLYAKKSLQNEKLYKVSCVIYLVFYCLHLFILDSVRIVSSMSYTVGIFLLAIMVYLEFVKQIKSDEILNYQNNKMFYINVGVLLFYIGTLPFFAFDKILYENNKELWNNYFTFFLISVNVMYILFIASFVWGKPKS
jgi:hypothetical protein